MIYKVINVDNITKLMAQIVQAICAIVRFIGHGRGYHRHHRLSSVRRHRLCRGSTYRRHRCLCCGNCRSTSRCSSRMSGASCYYLHYCCCSD